MRIVLADDHVLVRAGMRALLERIEGVSVVAEAGNGREAASLANELAPDGVVMDISMKELNGIEATGLIKAQAPGVRVIIVSMHTTEDYVVRAMRAGADGYLVKDAAPLELRMALDALARGEVFVSSRVSAHLVAGLRVAQAEGGPKESLDGLTARQKEILQMIAEGRTTKEIAFALGVSVKTVETHRAAIMERLGIRDVAGLVVHAIRAGLISIDPPPS
jgi:DNA-binding NarL/FixJ family response regulator